MRRSLAAIALAFAFVLGSLPAWADDLDAAVNAFRGDSLPVDGWLDSFAQKAADRQAAAGDTSHSNLGPLLERCSAAGEVVGMAPDLGTIFDLFAKSSTHRTIIREGKWTHMGGGQARTSKGLFVAVVFCTMKDSEPHCVGNACDAEGTDLRDRAVSRGNLSTAFFVVGLVGLAGGAALYLTAPSDTAPRVGIRPGFISLEGSF